MIRTALILAAVTLFSTVALANLAMAPTGSTPPPSLSGAVPVPGYSVVNGDPSSTGRMIPGYSVVRFN
jgi:hypothetical protein